MKWSAILLAIATSILGCEGKAGGEPPKMPGQWVDLGGRRLHVILAGESPAGKSVPTVIFENGAGAFALDWALVQVEVAKFARTIAYDRAGYAWSDPGPLQDSFEQTVDDLHQLQRHLAVQGPVLLVGASLGAAYVRAYQRRFPEKVAGLLIVDGTHEERITFALDGVRRPMCEFDAGELRRAYARYKVEAPKPRLGAADQFPLSRLAPESRAAQHWAMGKFIDEVGLLPSTIEAAESWRQEFQAQRKQRRSMEYPLGALPMVVLERSEDFEASWHQQQQELAGLSRRGVWRKVANSGHMIHLSQPLEVAAAVREVLAMIAGNPTGGASK